MVHLSCLDRTESEDINFEATSNLVSIPAVSDSTKLIDGSDILQQVVSTIRNWNLSTEILVAVQRRFFGSWLPLAPLPQDGPAIYALNHQIGCDLGLLCLPIAFSTQCKVSIVVADSASDSQHGKLIDFMTSHPLYAKEDPRVSYGAISFNPDEPRTTKFALEEMQKRLETESLVVAIEGKAQSADEQPVVRASSLLTRLSQRTGRPIVPVRVSGGLPPSPAHFRAFPHDYGPIQVVSGQPITASELQRYEGSQRVQYVLDAINDLIGQGPNKPHDNSCNAPHKLFTASVADRQIRTGSSAVKCVLTELLLQGPLHGQENEEFRTLFQPNVRHIPPVFDTDWDRRFIGWLTDGLNLPEGPDKYDWMCAQITEKALSRD